MIHPPIDPLAVAHMGQLLLFINLPLSCHSDRGCYTRNGNCNLFVTAVTTPNCQLLHEIIRAAVEQNKSILLTVWFHLHLFPLVPLAVLNIHFFFVQTCRCCLWKSHTAALALSPPLMVNCAPMAPPEAKARAASLRPT